MADDRNVILYLKHDKTTKMLTMKSAISSMRRELESGIFLGRYDMRLDGWRITVPAEWVRVFRADGGAAAFALGEGRLALTTRELAESATDGKELNLVSCKMDERGRVVLPREFRQFLANAKTVLMVGKIGYIELKPCVLSPCSFIQVKNKENL